MLANDGQKPNTKP